MAGRTPKVGNMICLGLGLGVLTLPVLGAGLDSQLNLDGDIPVAAISGIELNLLDSSEVGSSAGSEIEDSTDNKEASFENTTSTGTETSLDPGDADAVLEPDNDEDVALRPVESEDKAQGDELENSTVGTISAIEKEETIEPIESEENETLGDEESSLKEGAPEEDDEELGITVIDFIPSPGCGLFQGTFDERGNYEIKLNSLLAELYAPHITRDEIDCTFQLTMLMPKGMRGKTTGMRAGFTYNVLNRATANIDLSYQDIAGPHNSVVERIRAESQESSLSEDVSLHVQLEDSGFSDCTGRVTVEGRIEMSVSSTSSGSKGSLLRLGNDLQPHIELGMEYQPCVEEPFAWIEGNLGSVPEGAVSAGSQFDFRGQQREVYLCRVEGRLHTFVGELVAGKNYCSYLDGLRSKRSIDYEVLVINFGDFRNYFHWKPFDLDPQPAVFGRFERNFFRGPVEKEKEEEEEEIDPRTWLTENGLPVGKEGRHQSYVCRVNKFGFAAIGTITSNLNGCLVEVYGVREVQQFEVLGTNSN